MDERPGTRRAFAAAHVVADPTRSSQGEARASIDLEATLAFRRYLSSLGFGVAEAMDTAQRGAGVDWESASELIAATLHELGDTTEIVCGVASDHLAADSPSLESIAEAYLEQLDFVESRGGVGVLMCSRQLAAAASSADDYLAVYRSVLSGARRPVILHWLGEAFDPALARYWSPESLDEAEEVVLELCGSGSVDGVKLSLLDADREIDLRRRLPDDVRLYTGDDFNFVDLIAGDAHGYSDALLGVLDPLAPVASEALRALARGDEPGYRALLEPTVPLARKIFEPPTRFYKTGVVWLAYLGGHQDHFRMVAGAESGRSVTHLIGLYRMAAGLGLFPDPELARNRADRLAGAAGLA